MTSAPILLRGDAFDADCPTRVVLDQLAGKWSVLALGALEAGPLRFNALKRRLQGISQKMLVQTLRELERNGLVVRRAFPTVPATVEYSLTSLGAELASPTEAFRSWIESHIGHLIAAQRRFDASAPR